MGLRSDLKSIVSGAIGALGDIPLEFTFTSTNQVSYDTTTGVTSRTSTSLTVKGVLVNFKMYEVGDMNLVATGRKALIPASQFGTTDPDAFDDTVTTSDGRSWKVKQVLKDPSDSLYTLMLIRIND